MAIRYQFFVSCKRASETTWRMELKAEHGDVPLSIVQPDTRETGIVTTEPIVQEVTDSNLMVRYLRQLCRRNGRRGVGHNQAVVWNLSQRLSQLQLGQEVVVRVVYFGPKGMNSGSYEINSLGVFPQSKAVEKEVLSPTVELPQAVIDTITNLASRVEALQSDYEAMRNVLENQERRICAMERYISTLEAENRELRRIQNIEANPLEETSAAVRDDLQPVSDKKVTEPRTSHKTEPEGAEEKEETERVRVMFKRIFRASSS